MHRSHFQRTPLSTSIADFFRTPIYVGMALAFCAVAEARAGDILRGGSTLGGSNSGKNAAAGTPNAAAEQARLNAKDALARTTMALKSVRAMQEAARNAAVSGPNRLGRNLPDVRDGLTTGGLQVAPGVPANLKTPQAGEDPKLWRGAALPRQSERNGRVNVTVLQTQSQAVLNWKTFNVGKKTTLRFDQSRGGADKSQWIAFNKINDPSGTPSQILGKIEAPGQVYVINPNGIIFGGSTQINLHGLVASSLPINDGLIARGLLNNPDSHFLFSALPIEAGSKGGTPAFKPVASNAPGGKYGDVEVQPGAQITSPTTGANVGGRVMLVGPNVKNAGTISTPDGQTILAAGLQVGVKAHPSTDARLRGLDVYVGAVSVPPANAGDPPVIPPQRAAGTATNSGLIEVPRGNATIAGKTVNQLGGIASTTSVSLNGSVSLQANFGAQIIVPSGTAEPFFAFTGSGTVTLGGGSVMEILPEYDSNKTVIGTELALRSQATIQGRNIFFGTDALLLAPNADVGLSVGEWLSNGQGRTFTSSSGQIYLSSGSMLNVAGSTDITVPVSQNILSLELRGAELADAPLQRRGPLRGPTLHLDIRNRGVFNGVEWVGTPLGNAAGYVGLIERNVGELTTAGGTVTMNAGGSVVIQRGAKVDVSGGFVNFEGGMVQTTRIISDGRIVDIANAMPDRVHTSLYDGTFTVLHPKYGHTKTFGHPLDLNGQYFEPSYVDGRAGGSIAIAAPAMALDGELLGQTVSGPRQRATASAVKLGALSLTFEKQDAAVLNYRSFSPTPPTVVFGQDTLPEVGAFTTDTLGNAASLSASRLAKVVLAPGLFQNFGSLTINNGDGDFLLPEETDLVLPARGSLAVTAANVSLQSSITAPGGSLSFTALNTTPYLDHRFPDGNRVTPAVDPTRGHFDLGPLGTLSVAGLIVDDRPLALAPLSRPLAVDGGSINVAGFNVALAAGSTLDASGGVVLARDGRRTYGAGGSITIRAGNDPKVPQLIGGNLSLGAALQAFSGARGGSLTVQAPSVQIGGTTAPTANTLHLMPEFFTHGGFTQYTLIGLGEKTGGAATEFAPAITVAPGTRIAPVAENWVAIPYGPAREGAELFPILQPQGLRTPASLALNAPGLRDDFNSNALVVRGDIVIGRGAIIETDPRATVSVSGETITHLGSIIAPGGSITVAGSRNLGAAFNNSAISLTSVHLAPGSLLSTKGTVLYTPNAFGFRTGSVLPGGRISVSGNIVAESGAVLDVSGTSGILDLAPALTEEGQAILDTSVIPQNSGVNAPLYTRTLVATRVDSDAGEIVLTGGQHLYNDATLLGFAGGPTALGGSLTVSSGRFYAVGAVSNPLDVTLRVKQNGPVLSPGSAVEIGRSVAAQGLGNFAVSSFSGGGFDSLNLRGTVQFSGPVSINARRTLTVADAGVIYADDRTTLRAPYVTLGTPFLPPDLRATAPFLDGSGQEFKFKPTHGDGSLTVIADLIDIGNLSLQNIGTARFIADRGDIRGNGTLNVAGDIVLRAGQIYPPTAVAFNIIADDYKVGDTLTPGSVTITGSGSRSLPLSAGGQLNIFGSEIRQGGTLRAPLGSINIGWDGTGAAPINPITEEAVGKTTLITLAPGSLTSVSAIAPQDGTSLVIPFGLNVNGVTWIDPIGTDITAGGVAQKTVKISGANINSMAGSLIDIRGGGDLFAYRWVPGIGGSRDLLSTLTSFAVIPGYNAHYAPYAPFNPAPLTPGLDGAPGYVNSALRVGDCIHLAASGDLPEGNYTLLPARYALLPGAHLVTLKSGTPIGSLALPDGSVLSPGYRFNGLNQQRVLDPQYAWFEVLSPEAIRSRAEYAGYLGNAFLRAGAASVEATIPRVADDAGQLTLQAIDSMTLRGRVAADAPRRSRGGLVDIASPVDIVITRAGASAGAGKLSLDAGQLSSFGAESLLIGGTRTINGDGTATVSVKTGNLTVDNAGTPLRGPEIILVAKNTLAISDGARIEQSGRLSSRADTLLLGTEGVAGSGDGTLLRVTSDTGATIVRSGLGNSTTANMIVGAGATIAGGNVILDSTFGTSLDPAARIKAGTVALSSGQVSIQLDNPGILNATSGLVLGGAALRSLEQSGSVSLLSYTTLDLYGTGTLDFDGALALRAGAIRGFNNNGGIATIQADSILLENRANAAAPASTGELSGTLNLKAATITIGENKLALQKFSAIQLDASGGILARGSGGITAQGNLTLNTPLLTAARSATQAISAAGTLTIEGTGTGSVKGGLGASLALQGSGVSVGSSIVLPSGLLTIRATQQNVEIGGKLLLNGTTQTFYDLTRHTSGGTVNIIADNGSVSLGADSVVNVSAPAAGGDGGTVLISNPRGTFASNGELLGKAGRGGKAGTFALDAGSVADVAALLAPLGAGGFVESQNIRVRTGDVTLGGTIAANHFAFSTDTGSLTVTGTVDASGQRGGSISLAAGGSLILESGSKLTVAAQEFDAAGKGGRIFLETRGLGGGTVQIHSGSTLDLGVAANTADSAARGQFTGTLHLRAPQNSTASDMAVGVIAGDIIGASSIIAEGYRVFDLSSTSGIITSTGTTNALGGAMTAAMNVQGSVLANGNLFIGTNGNPSATYSAMFARITGGNTALLDALSIRSGAEIIHNTGNLTLGTSSSTATSDWNLATFRFGPDAAPGVLTLRAAGNLVFFNSLSDGFQTAAYNSALLPQNTALSANAQSWTYRLIAGADLSAADFSRVKSATELTAGAGSLLLGKNGGNGVFVTPGAGALTATAVGNRYQAIRTGSGDITIAAGRDVQLLNQFSVIFTAGTQVANATQLPGGGSFDVPVLNAAGGTANLGAVQQSPGYAAQYTFGGGNISITAGADIARYTRNTANQLVADSTRQLPTNWLYRRGYIETSGEFGTARFGDVASTTWWVDFSNFFQGVGALGGGNVSLQAGNNVANVDAVAPTNARMAKGTPNAANLYELGGGDISIRAGNNIDGGIYYVERGRGVLAAGGDITTNSTRSPSLGSIRNPADIAPAETWLPTSFFLGKGRFEVSARGDLLLGPTANPFLMPGGYNNTFWYKTYFSTYGSSSAISATSLSGDVTLRFGATLPTDGIGDATPLYLAWLQKELLLTPNPDTAAYYQPWLRLNESSVTPFATAASLLPGTLETTAFAGDINVVGSLNLSPSATGNLSLIASGSVNGLNQNGSTTIAGAATKSWGVARINLSDANPANVPGAINPFAYQNVLPASPTPGAASTTGVNLLASVDALFAETGSTRSVLQTKQALHAPGLLHAADTEPLRIYAGTGDIQGITLFSPKPAQVLAGKDITDIALYLQNTSDDSISIVASGRDIVAYNANSPARVLAQSSGNALNFNSAPLAGDLQISGPGTLQVLAGRNLDLGTGKSNSDGTGLGIVSIGNARNPSLPFDGADLIVGAGIGSSAGLSASTLDFDSFTNSADTARYADELAELLGENATTLENLPTAQRDLAALQLFYFTLRDAGRDRNDPASPGFGNYDAGFKSISTLFTNSTAQGDISLTSRQIKTQSGGDVSIFAPGGKIIVGFDAGAGQTLDQGILTESGGNIHIFAHDSVTLGTSRIFTLRGGNEIIWSSTGNIAAGTSSKTVASAPPTRVLIDPQSADLKTDLAGLATGGGIGVLATVEGIPPGDVDLIAPNGAIDAGDAGIRSAGNLNVAATTVLNAENIQVTGASAGAPSTVAPAAPSFAVAPPPPPNTVSNSSSADPGQRAEETRKEEVRREEPPSIIVVEVLGYGGGEAPGNG